MCCNSSSSSNRNTCFEYIVYAWHKHRKGVWFFSLSLDCVYNTTYKLKIYNSVSIDSLMVDVYKPDCVPVLVNNANTEFYTHTVCKKTKHVLFCMCVLCVCICKWDEISWIDAIKQSANLTLHFFFPVHFFPLEKQCIQFWFEVFLFLNTKSFRSLFFYRSKKIVFVVVDVSHMNSFWTDRSRCVSANLSIIFVGIGFPCMFKWIFLFRFSRGLLYKDYTAVVFSIKQSMENGVVTGR